MFILWNDHIKSSQHPSPHVVKFLCVWWELLRPVPFCSTHLCLLSFTSYTSPQYLIGSKVPFSWIYHWFLQFNFCHSFSILVFEDRCCVLELRSVLIPRWLTHTLILQAQNNSWANGCMYKKRTMFPNKSSLLPKVCLDLCFMRADIALDSGRLCVDKSLNFAGRLCLGLAQS